MHLAFIIFIGAGFTKASTVIPPGGFHVAWTGYLSGDVDIVGQFWSSHPVDFAFTDDCEAPKDSTSQLRYLQQFTVRNTEHVDLNSADSATVPSGDYCLLFVNPGTKDVEVKYSFAIFNLDLTQYWWLVVIIVVVAVYYSPRENRRPSIVEKNEIYLP